MARKFQNFVSGTLSAGFSNSATNLTSTGFSAMAAVSNPDTLVVALDPDGIDGAPEIVHVTAHSASSQTATVLRGQQGTVARTHNQDTAWVAAVVATDFERLDTIEAAGWVTSTRIVDGAVTAGKIGSGAVTAGKLGAGAVNAANLFGAGVVDGAALANGAVTSGKLGGSAVISSNLAAGAVTTAAIAAGAVTQDKLSGVSFTPGTGSITTAMLANDAVTVDKIGAGAVGTTELAAGAVTADKIASGVKLVVTDVGSVTIARYTGTVAIDQTFTVSHGIGSDVHRRILSVQGFYKGNSGEAVTLNIGAIDTVAIYSSGATVGRAAYIVLTYTDSQVSW